MDLCSARTLARAMEGTHSIRPSSGDVGKTLATHTSLRKMVLSLEQPTCTHDCSKRVSPVTSVMFARLCCGQVFLIWVPAELECSKSSVAPVWRQVKVQVFALEQAVHE